MASRTLPATFSTLTTVVALLYAELASTIQVHGLELPAGWTPASGKTVLVTNNGGPANVSSPELDETFTVHAYGPQATDILTVNEAVFNALHRYEGRTTVIAAGTVYIGLVERVAGPFSNRDPLTEWMRFTTVYRVVMSEWVAP